MSGAAMEGGVGGGKGAAEEEEAELEEKHVPQKGRGRSRPDRYTISMEVEVIQGDIRLRAKTLKV